MLTQPRAGLYDGKLAVAVDFELDVHGKARVICAVVALLKMCLNAPQKRNQRHQVDVAEDRAAIRDQTGAPNVNGFIGVRAVFVDVLKYQDLFCDLGPVGFCDQVFADLCIDKVLFKVGVVNVAG